MDDCNELIRLKQTGMVTMLKKQVPGSSEAQAWGAASAFFVFFFTGIFASSWLDVPFVYPTETFPLEASSFLVSRSTRSLTKIQVRAKGNAFGTVDWGLGCGSVSLLVPVWFSSEYLCFQIPLPFVFTST